MQHPLYAAIHRVIHDPLLQPLLDKLADLRIFTSVTAYVIPDAGEIVVHQSPRFQILSRQGVQRFGEHGERQNTFFMLNKLRMAMLEIFPLSMRFGTPFCASPLKIQ